MLATVSTRATSWLICVAVLYGAVATSAVASICERAGSAQRVGLGFVIDGDTLALVDGRRVRLIGINTPELGRDGHPDEPLANEARLALQRFLEGADSVLVQAGSMSQDRYGRMLAHVFSGNRPAGAAGEVSAACHLLRSGLAWRVTVPPNLRYQRDYSLAERQAREVRRGLWSAQLRSRSGGLGSGFRLLKATIDDIDLGRDWWLKTDDGFIVHIDEDDQQYFDSGWLSGLVSTAVEIRGWMYRRGGTPWSGRDARAWVLRLNHPESIQVLEQEKG